MFIIYNSFAIAVTERRSEIGILRALGATRGQIRWLFLGESVVTGLIGSALGVVAGLLIARGIAASVTALVSDTFGAARESERCSSARLCCWPPPRSASPQASSARSFRRAPLRALNRCTRSRKASRSSILGEAHRVRVLTAIAAGVVSIVCLLVGSTRAIFYTSYLLAIAAVLVVAPLLSLSLARLSRPLLTWLRPVEGALAADSLIQAPRRTSATVAALMLSIALAVVFGGMARASHGSIMEWARTMLNPDLYVTPSPDIVMRTIRFPDSMTKELEGVAGVRRLQAVREAHVVFQGRPVMLIAADMLSIEELIPVRIVAGGRNMFADAAAGRGVVVSDNLARLHRLHAGEIVELTAPGGAIRLPIAGIIVDYTDQQGSILIDRSLFQQYWQDDSVNFYRVYLSPEARIADVRRRILERYAGQRQVFVLNNDELKNYVLRITDQWFGLTYLQIAVAVLVAILGIVNTLTVSITDRRRELGVLRALGARKRQVRRTIWMEALATSGIGIALGFALGAINLYYVLEIVRHDVAGMQLDYQFPTMVAFVVASTILGAAFLAALWPSEAAVRGSLVEALEYE